MTTMIEPAPQVLSMRKRLLIFPLIAIPFLLIAFFALGGGKGLTAGGKIAKATGMGFNVKLPEPVFSSKQGSKDKMDFYKKADADSLRRKELIRQDPYHVAAPAHVTAAKDYVHTIQHAEHVTIKDVKTEELLKQLAVLKGSLDQERVGEVAARAGGGMGVSEHPGKTLHDHGYVRQGRVVEESSQGAREKLMKQVRFDGNAETDPELARLSNMLDKIALIQRDGREKGDAGVGDAVLSESREHKEHETTGGPGQLLAVTVPAIVQGDQRLTNGATIALRLTEQITVHGISIPSDQLLYGVVAINNDRMMVTISSIRSEQSILLVGLQAYDLDGQQGIYIPDMLSRQVGRTAADQGIGGLNFSTYDASVGAQATNAGIQAAKNLFSRKMRQVWVSVRGGYRVLLRDVKGSDVRIACQAVHDSTGERVREPVIAVTREKEQTDTAASTLPVKVPDDTLRIAAIRETAAVRVLAPPPPDSLKPFLRKSVCEGTATLVLQGVYLRDGLMWLSLLCRNNSRISYLPDYIRCAVREGRRLRRIATQDIPLELLYKQMPGPVNDVSEGRILLGMRPVVLEKNKRLFVQLAQQDGSRELLLEVSPKVLSKAK